MTDVDARDIPAGAEPLWQQPPPGVFALGRDRLGVTPGFKRHRGLGFDRTLHFWGSAPRERVFAEAWQEENDPNQVINCGLGRLYDVVGFSWGPVDPANPRRPSRFYPLRRRDCVIVATVIQWLATNVGFCWLEETLRRAGYRIVREHRR